VHDQDVRDAARQADRREVPDRVIGQLGVKPGIHAMRGNVGEKQRVAVRRSLGRKLGAEQPARTGAVVDDDLLADLGADMGCERAAHRVGRAADGLRDDDPDGALLRIGLRLRGHRNGEESDGENSKHQTCKRHVRIPQAKTGRRL
jgi:hypothetical protein